jgi:hypothetical protein
MTSTTRLPLLLLLLSTGLLLAQDKKKPPPKDQPKVLMALPFGVKPGAGAKVTLRGLKLDNAKEVRLSPKGTVKLLKKSKSPPPNNQMTADKVGDSQVELEVTLPADVAGDTVQLVVSTPGGQSAPHHLRIDRTPIIAEKEPNNGFKQAQPVAIGQVVQGSISSAQDVDMFRFEGKAGQKVVLEVHAARYGSPLDSVLTLYDSAGDIVDTCDDLEDTPDSRIESTLPKTGVYYAAVSDAHDQGAAFFLYRLTLRAK